jgi:hypothetical protein
MIRLKLESQLPLEVPVRLARGGYRPEVDAVDAVFRSGGCPASVADGSGHLWRLGGAGQSPSIPAECSEHRSKADAPGLDLGAQRLKHPLNPINADRE